MTEYINYYTSMITGTLYKTSSNSDDLWMWIRQVGHKYPTWYKCQLHNKTNLPITLTEVVI